MEVDPWIYLYIYYSRCHAPHTFPSHLWVYKLHALPLRYKVINIFYISQALIELCPVCCVPNMAKSTRFGGCVHMDLMYSTLVYVLRSQKTTQSLG
jgi:hypothetical protein